MKVNKKEIIVRLLKQIYDLVDYNLELKNTIEKLKRKIYLIENDKE